MWYNISVKGKVMYPLQSTFLVLLLSMLAAVIIGPVKFSYNENAVRWGFFHVSLFFFAVFSFIYLAVTK